MRWGRARCAAPRGLAQLPAAPRLAGGDFLHRDHFTGSRGRREALGPRPAAPTTRGRQKPKSNPPQAPAPPAIYRCRRGNGYEQEPAGGEGAPAPHSPTRAGPGPLLGQQACSSPPRNGPTPGQQQHGPHRLEPLPGPGTHWPGLPSPQGGWALLVPGQGLTALPSPPWLGRHWREVPAAGKVAHLPQLSLS